VQEEATPSSTEQNVPNTKMPEKIEQRNDDGPSKLKKNLSVAHDAYSFIKSLR
jgi:hypothetical protein